MRIEFERKYDFRDVLIRPKRSTLKSRNDVSLERTFRFKWSPKTLTCIPIMTSNMDTIGTLSVAKVLGADKLITVLHKYHTAEEIREFKIQNETVMPYVCVSIGMSNDELNYIIPIIVENKIDMLCLDIANGYIEEFENFVRLVRSLLPDIILIAGNVATPDMTEQLILAGCDIVKVGIGPGSVCETRRQTGVGYPQLSAIIECADAANGLGGLIIGDGGCRETEDITKAFGGGAHFVMLGGMFAGYQECAGDIVDINGVSYKEFYGMSSERAMLKHAGSVAEYRAPEGKRTLVKCKGTIKKKVNHILGGVRSMCSYIGARSIKEVSKRTTFVVVSPRTQPYTDENEE